MKKKLGVLGAVVIISSNLYAQFPTGLEAIHASISNLSRGATTSTINTWADGVLGTTEAIRVTNNPSNVSYSGELSSTERTMHQRNLSTINRIQSASQLNERITTHRRYIQFADNERAYMVARATAYNLRNNTNSSEYRNAVRTMRYLNNVILTGKITESQLLARARALGLQQMNNGTFAVAGNNSSSASAERSRTQRTPVTSASTNRRITTPRRSIMSGLNTTLRRVGGTISAFGRFLGRFRPRGGGGRLYEAIAIDNSKSPEQKQPALVSIYPNPTVDYINVKLNQELQNIQAQLYDLRGRMILNQQISGNQRVHSFLLSGLNLTKGTYILNIVHEGQLLGAEKMYVK